MFAQTIHAAKKESGRKGDVRAYNAIPLLLLVLFGERDTHKKEKKT